MFHTIQGKLRFVGAEYIIVESGNFGFKLIVNSGTAKSLPVVGEDVRLHCFLYIKEKEVELYGLLNEQSLKLFEMLTSVSGIGPKTALAILDVSSIEKVAAAIIEKRTDFLIRAPGIGKKTAERAILELHNKLHLPDSEKLAGTMGVDADVEEALISLGYAARDAREAVSRLGSEPTKLEERLKAALRLLS